MGDLNEPPRSANLMEWRNSQGRVLAKIEQPAPIQTCERIYQPPSRRSVWGHRIKYGFLYAIGRWDGPDG